MQFRFHVAQSLRAMVAVVFIAQHQQLRLITLFRVRGVGDTIGRTLYLLAINAITLRQISRSKIWDGDFAHFHANQLVQLGEFSAQVARIIDGFHT
jgi:hypothetical protein